MKLAIILIMTLLAIVLTIIAIVSAIVYLRFDMICAAGLMTVLLYVLYLSVLPEPHIRNKYPY